MSTSTMPAALAGCCVISLRPVGLHAALRRAAEAHGARVVALSPWKLVGRGDDATRRALREGLRAAHVIATSPAAARAAAALQPLHARSAQHWYATGTGTAAALRRAGIDVVRIPGRMDSEGLLALPALRAIDGVDVALLTAPGGRDALAPTLERRGARVRRVDVYARVPVAPSARSIATLRAVCTPVWLMLSSGEALTRTLDVLPADLVERLRAARVSVASARLAELARRHGFDRVIVAGDARPASLVEAAARFQRAGGTPPASGITPIR